MAKEVPVRPAERAGPPRNAKKQSPRRDDCSGDEDGVESGSGPSRGGHYLAVAHPGDYTVTLPPIKGHEPIAPIDVTIRDQEFSEIVVELVRKQK